MAEDEHAADEAKERVRQHPILGGHIPMRMRVARLVVSEPADTDNGQCWNEEIFSTLSA
jgi:hypothetical protein